MTFQCVVPRPSEPVKDCGPQSTQQKPGLALSLNEILIVVDNDVINVLDRLYVLPAGLLHM